MNSLTEFSTHLIGFENIVSTLISKGWMHKFYEVFLTSYSQMKICPGENLIRNNAWRLMCSRLEQYQWKYSKTEEKYSILNRQKYIAFIMQ